MQVASKVSRPEQSGLGNGADLGARMVQASKSGSDDLNLDLRLAIAINAYMV